MPPTTSEMERDLLRVLNEVLGTPEVEERRSQPRKAFDTIHRIAPLRGLKLPEDIEFFPVRCHDLSQAGFSFFLPNEPEFSRLAVMLGSPPDVIYVAAEIVNCRAACIGGHTSPDKPSTLVGCRFLRRMPR